MISAFYQIPWYWVVLGLLCAYGVYIVLRLLVWPPVKFPMSQFGLADAPFLLAVLRECPAGCEINFGESEPDHWVERLRPWSHRAKPEQFEADYYTIDEGFITELASLLEANPADLDQCHHLWIASDTEGSILDSLDNFTIVNLKGSIEEKLRQRFRRK
jgi:hypothetical protein